jgi:uncharacterized protein YxjI
MAFYNYPLTLKFKLVALSPQIRIFDAAGQHVAYVHQKVFNIREDIRIYSDESRSLEVFRIHTDKVFDFNAKYYFTLSATGQDLGYVQPAGLRSIWSATYRIYAPDGSTSHFIKEDNPWVKVLDALVSAIPYVELFTGYFLNPTYTAYRGADIENPTQPALHLTKKPAFFESTFTIEDMGVQSQEEEMRMLLGVLLMVQFMRRRG